MNLWLWDKKLRRWSEDDDWHVTLASGPAPSRLRGQPVGVVDDAEIPRDWVHYVDDVRVEELCGPRLELTLWDADRVAYENASRVMDARDCVSFGQTDGGGLLFFDVQGRIFARPWAVGLALDGELPRASGWGAVYAGASVTELFGAALAGYSAAGVPDIGYVSAPERPPFLDLATAARHALPAVRDHVCSAHVLEPQPAVDDQGVFPVWRHEPAPDDAARSLACGQFTDPIATVLETLYEHTSETTLLVAPDRWVHLESMEGLVQAGANHPAPLGWTRPDRARFGVVCDGGESLVLALVADGNGAVVHAARAADSVALAWRSLPVARSIPSTIERVVASWAAGTSLARELGLA